jgi:hypothetical protein
MLSVKIYRNLRRNFCYGIYFNKFHAICKGKFQKCDHIYLAIHSHLSYMREYSDAIKLPKSYPPWWAGITN